MNRNNFCQPIVECLITLKLYSGCTDEEKIEAVINIINRLDLTADDFSNAIDELMSLNRPTKDECLIYEILKNIYEN